MVYISRKTHNPIVLRFLVRSSILVFYEFIHNSSVPNIQMLVKNST